MPFYKSKNLSKCYCGCHGIGVGHCDETWDSMSFKNCAWRHRDET